MTRLAAVFAVVTLVLALLCAPSVVAEEAAVTETSAELNVEELVMQPGKTQTLKFQLLPAASSTAGTVWTSDNEDVAIVSNAVVTAVAEGEATITAISPNGLKDTCKVTVVSGKLVLENGSFAQENQTAWVLDGAVIEENGGHGDTACAKVAHGNTLSQTMKNLEADTTYVLFMRTKMSDDAAMTLAVKAGAETVLEKELTLGKSWGTRSVEFTTPAELTGDLTLVFNGPAAELTYWLDGIVVSKKAADADLVVDVLDWDGGDGQVKPDTELTFKATVSNVGTADVTGAFSVDIAFGTETILTLTHEGGLKAGESVTLTSEAWKAVAGDKMVSARVNPDLAVEESNYATNNTYQTNLRVAEDRYAPAYDAVAADVTEAGMFDLTFSDDFTDLSSVDTLASGDTGYKWYVSRQWAQTDMTREDYFVKDGVFTLEHLDSKYAIGASTIDCDTHTGYSWNKGYLEVKLRIPEPIKNEGVKSYPAIWSLPPGKWCEIAGQNKHWIEMDWLEYYGRDNGYYTVTVHELKQEEDGTQSQYTSGDNARHGLNDKEWHVMGFLWEENRLRCYVDGEMIREQAWGGTPIPMHQNKEGEFRFEGVFEIFNDQDMLLYIAGGRDVPLELDYIRVWQLGGEEPTEEQPEETPDTGASSAVPALATLLTASAAVLCAIRKRR